MIKFAQLTIYEGFGYFLPGTIVVAAFAIIAWTEWAPCTPLPIFSPSFDLWAVLIVVAYYAGHAVQGVGNFLLDYNCPLQQWLQDNTLWQKVTKWIDQLFGKQREDFDPSIEDMATRKAGKVLQLSEGTKLDFVWVKRLADESLVQLGTSSELDVYVYREGFYRGSCLSLFVFAIAVWFRAWKGHAWVNFWYHDHEVYRWELFWLAILCMLAAWIFWRRFNRFGEAHRRGSILGFLLLDKPHPSTPTAGQQD